MTTDELIERALRERSTQSYGRTTGIEARVQVCEWAAIRGQDGRWRPRDGYRAEFAAGYLTWQECILAQLEDQAIEDARAAEFMAAREAIIAKYDAIIAERVSNA